MITVKLTEKEYLYACEMISSLLDGDMFEGKVQEWDDELYGCLNVCMAFMRAGRNNRT